MGGALAGVEGDCDGLRALPVLRVHLELRTLAVFRFVELPCALDALPAAAACEQDGQEDQRRQRNRRDAGDDAGGSTRKALAPAATAPAVAAAGTASAAPEKTVAPESRVGANPDDAAEETVVETEVDMRPKRTRKPRERKKTRTVAPIAAVAAPFGLLVARNLFRHFMSRGVKKGDAAKTASNENPRTKKSLAASEPILSLRAKAAIARAGSVANPLSSTDANRLAELDRVIGFQAKELRFMRVTLAEKDKRIAQLLRARVAAPVVDEREKRIAWRDDDEREMSRIEPNDDDDAYDLDATVDMTVDMTVDEVLRELAEEKNQTVRVRETKEKRATGLAVASRRASVVAAARPAPPVAAKGNGVPFAARGKENEELSMKTRLAGRFLDVSDEDSDETPVSRRGALGARNADTTRSRVSFLDPAVRVARGKSRVHRISPTRRQRETERAVAAESSLRLVR